jgi:hypothetical protein
VSTLEQLDQAVVDDMRELFEAVAAQVPVRTVTVIGNAPLEPDGNRVAIIESSDLVVRCNSLVLDEPGEPARLGRKTDVVVAARRTRITPWFFQDYPRRVYLMNDAETVRWPDPPPPPRSWPGDLAVWPIPNRVFGWPLKRLIQPETHGRGAVPTTGSTSAYVARRLFGEAQLYLTGFSYLSNRSQTTWMHQWGDESPVHPTHKIDREGALLQSWVDDGSAVFLP